MASDLAAFIRYLGHSHIAIKSIVTGKPGAQEGHFQAITINKAEEFIALRNGKRQLWINLQKLKPDVGRYIAFSDIESYKNVYIDLDCKKPDGLKDYAATEEERATALLQLPILQTWLESHSLRCGLALHTGNGAGMVLPIPETKAEPVFIAKLATFLKLVQADIPCTDPAMFDPPRVIGIPGTINAKLETDDRKNQAREIVGDIPARVEDQALLSLIQSLEPDPVALKEWSKKYSEPQAQPETDKGTLDAEDIIDRLTGLFEYEPELKALLDGNVERFKGDRSAAEYGVCGRLVKFGFTDSEIDLIMCKVSKIGKWQEEGPHYRFEQTLRKLREAEEELTGSHRICGPHENVSIKRADADRFEADHPGCKIFNCDDDPLKPGMSQEEFDNFKLPSGPKFSINLPADHFITRFIGYGTAISDAYKVYWFMSAIFMLGVIADKKLMFKTRMAIFYMNIWIYILGDSSLARKTTAIQKAYDMLKAVMGDRFVNACVPNTFSPEAFTEHMSDYQHAPWIRDEAAGVLSIMQKDYMRGFKDDLMQLFDCHPITRMLRTKKSGEKSRFNVDDPYLNLFFASTGAALGYNLDLIDKETGFLARFVFAYPQDEKENYMPLDKGAAIHSELEEICISQLSTINALIAAIPGCIDMCHSEDARLYYNKWQETREKEAAALKDGYSSQIFSRLNPTVMKLAMAFEMGSTDFDPTSPIREEYFREACRLVDTYFMPTTRAVYDLIGTANKENQIEKIVLYLTRHGGKATRKEIMRDVKIKSKEMTEYLLTMQECEMIEIKNVWKPETKRNTSYVFLKTHKVANVGKVVEVGKVEKVEEQINEETLKEKITVPTSSTFSTLATHPTHQDVECKDVSNSSNSAAVVVGGRDADIPASAKPQNEADRIREGHQKHVAELKKKADPDAPTNIRFVLDYKTDLPGKPYEIVKAGTLATVSSWRAEQYIKKGVAEAVMA